MSALPRTKDYCAFCMRDHGTPTEPMKEWDGFPMCREHVAEAIARANGEPVILATVEYQSLSLH